MMTGNLDERVAATLERIGEAGLYDIATDIALAHGLSLLDMISSGSKPAPRARAVFYRRLYDRFGYSTTAIGKLIGKDHSTIVDALKQVDPITRLRVAPVTPAPKPNGGTSR